MRIENLQNENRKYAKSIENFHVLEYVQDASVSPMNAMNEYFMSKMNVRNKMKLRASGEDYLEAVLMLQKKNGMVRSIDFARHMEVSKPSVSRTVAILQEGGFLTVDSDYFLHLTEAGQEVAEKIYE